MAHHLSVYQLESVHRTGWPGGRGGDIWWGTSGGVAYSDVILCDVANMDQPPRLHTNILYWLPRQQILDVTTPKEFLYGEQQLPWRWERERYCERRLYPGAVLVHEVNVLVTTHSKETKTCQYNMSQV